MYLTRNTNLIKITNDAYRHQECDSCDQAVYFNGLKTDFQCSADNVPVLLDIVERLDAIRSVDLRGMIVQIEMKSLESFVITMLQAPKGVPMVLIMSAIKGVVNPRTKIRPIRFLFDTLQ